MRFKSSIFLLNQQSQSLTFVENPTIWHDFKEINVKAGQYRIPKRKD